MAGQGQNQANGIWKLLDDYRKEIWFPIIGVVVATVIYWAMLTLGVALQNSVVIAITGIIVGLYFAAAAWILENAIEARTAENPPDAKLRDIRFLAVPYTAIAFWLALLPYWSFYGFVFVLFIGFLSLAVISSFWKDWPGRIWRIYHNVSKWAVVMAIICFAVNGLFPKAVQNTGKFLSDTINGWAKSLNEPKVANAISKDYAPGLSPKPTHRRIATSTHARKSPASKSGSARHGCDDLDRDAARAAYLKMEAMDMANRGRREK